ncbi:3135_t:CDS:2 [Scutellospora calospora]|uniref:3135_t:CDS:1 n=1 Tax=Scutellospora calospora TaxID=85575 RepID=A0ACA9LZL7_9GLOM|nr:3135_t:CDS:2 [Scutellospora calospora]
MLDELSDQLEKTFMNEEINIKSGVGKKMDVDDRVILNVGGIKYETFRSTLTAYPETLLGIMFADRNKEMLHPINGNEYFFDRDGHLFRHILQYYRTGMIHWPEQISCCEDLINQTCLKSKKLNKSNEKFETKDVIISQPVVDNVNGFLNSLLDVMHQLAGLFEKHIFITFYHDRQPPMFSLITPNLNVVKNETAPFRDNIRKLLLPYAGVGYTLLMNFEREIELYLKGEIPELIWSIEKPAGLPNRFILHLSFNDKFLKQQILRNSYLAKVVNDGDKTKGQTTDTNY